MTESVFQGRSLLSTRDYTKDELMYLIGFAEHLKDLKKRGVEHRYLAGKNIALLFEKTSTRTRAAFTTACITLAYCGQGRNNVQNSLMITSAILGVNYVNATPAELEPDPAIVEVARAFAAESGATITVTNDPVEAVENADAIYTNVWAAMGEESQFAERVKLMSPYQVNAELLSHVKNPDYIFLHCLPAFHNAETEYAADMAERFGVKEMEVTDEVFYSDHGRQFQQAENRMHTIKAIMAATLGDLYIPCV